MILGLGRSPGEGIGYPLQYSWTSLVAHLVKNPPAMQETGFNPWVGKIRWRRESLPTPVVWPGEFHGLYSPWGRKESDTTERLSLSRFEGSLILFYSQKIYMWLTEGKDPEEMKETEGGKRQKN